MVEYSLTPLGRTLCEPLQAICRWAEKHLPQLDGLRAFAILPVLLTHSWPDYPSLTWLRAQSCPILFAPCMN